MASVPLVAIARLSLASYNGDIEYSQGELKTWLRKWKNTVDNACEITVRVEDVNTAMSYAQDVA